VILLDPAYYPTITGDGQILFQYETVNNNDVTRGYATTGIQNGADNDGLLYTYYNDNASGAAYLREGRAILFTTNGPAGLGTCDVSQSALSITLEPGEECTETIDLSNSGSSSTYLYFDVKKVDPDPPEKVSGSTEKTIVGSVATISPSIFSVHQTIDLSLSVTCETNNVDMIRTVQLDFPPGVVVNSATSLDYAGQTLIPFIGFPGEDALLIWIFGSDDDYIPEGITGTASINATFEWADGAINIPYTMTSYWGSSVSGEIVLEQDILIGISSPAGGEEWAVGEQHEILFSGTGSASIENVLIELQREPGGPWSTLADDISFTSGSYQWTVTEPISAHCRIRVSEAVI